MIFAFRNLQGSIQIQRGERIAEHLNRNPGLDEGAEKHVAANPGVRIKIGQAHTKRIDRGR
jgi:hypothetical protein